MASPLLSLFFLPALAAADPCAGIDRALAEADRTALAPLIGRQLELRGVTIRESLHSGDWRVFLIGARGADDSFVFYAGDPASQRYVDAIGTFALPDGEAAIRRWLTESFTTMPGALAACVAHVAAEAAKS
ncbi:hypothetical protein [Tahibacter caeni]|uniref:hypothetical protein n=1 Tax=Tahibacter caeni TaxID=1453545 RepID=UPI0021476A23|nr:hypothetical protein [Tahibacter caeni]